MTRELHDCELVYSGSAHVRDGCVTEVVKQEICNLRLSAGFCKGPIYVSDRLPIAVKHPWVMQRPHSSQGSKGFLQLT